MKNFNMEAREVTPESAFPTGELQEQVELITPRIAAKLGETTKSPVFFFMFFWYKMDRTLLKMTKSIAAYVRNAYLYRCIYLQHVHKL